MFLLVELKMDFLNAFYHQVKSHFCTIAVMTMQHYSLCHLTLLVIIQSFSMAMYDTEN